MQKELPIWRIHEGILAALRAGNRLVVVAPTGSGKTTQIPQMLLDELASEGKGKIIVLQPRRVAARTVASRVAVERGCKLGAEVGYQVRFDDHTSLGTRLCFVTEGILLRWLQDNPELQGIDAVIFDEFHERNLFSDVALGLVKILQEKSRPDLKVVVMSATMDSKPVSDYLGTNDVAAPVLNAEGQTFPVQIKYLKKPETRTIWDSAAKQVQTIISEGLSGDILIFMAGRHEISMTISAVRAVVSNDQAIVIPLHGDLSPEDQDRAFASSDKRKIIVSTNVAETSVTIEGIQHVIDSGQARVARYDSERGINTLFVEEISRASADQRKGRAGRTGPGVCYRLWTESGQKNRSERNTPEIQRSDLAEVVLLIHSLGVGKAGTFPWLDKPEPESVEKAEKMLVELGALDEAGAVTGRGRAMLRIPVHPRYARILIEAKDRGCFVEAALCAALVSGRDLLTKAGKDQRQIVEARERFEDHESSDFDTLMRAYQFARSHGFDVDACKKNGVQAQVARQVDETFRHILKTAGEVDSSKTAEGKGDTESLSASDELAKCLLVGFVDQLCVRRAQGTLEADLRGGKSGNLMRESVVHKAPLFVAATFKEIDGKIGTKTTLLGLATGIQRSWLEEIFPGRQTENVEHVFDRAHKRVAAMRITRFGDLILERKHLPELDPDASGRCLAEAHLKGWFELPLFNHEVKQFMARVNMVRGVLPDLGLPTFDQAAVVKCLGEAFFGVSLAKEAQTIALKASFEHHLTKEQLDKVNELAPPSFTWMDGRKLKLTYQDSGNPAKSGGVVPELQVKLQDCFIYKNHPRVCEGRVPLRLIIATPEGKKIDVTEEWPAFKKTAYPKLRQSYIKKYPSVAWP